jgi:hypothetical protein
MPQRFSNQLRSAAASLLALLLAGALLAACGSSSSSGKSTTNSAGVTAGAPSKTSASTTAATTKTGAGATTTSKHRVPPPPSPAVIATLLKAITPGVKGELRQRFTSLRDCVKNAGVTLPSTGGKPLTAAQTTKLKAAVGKCAGLAGGKFLPSTSLFTSAKFRAGLVKYAECLRAAGVKLPAPNTSGTGPVFDLKGVDVTGAQYRAAVLKCAYVIRANLPATPTGSSG